MSCSYFPGFFDLPNPSSNAEALKHPRPDLAGAVLLGGLSRRMGRDKATLPFGPGTMLEYITRQLAAVCGAGVWLVAAADGPVPVVADTIVLRDRQPDRGPLEGVAVALQATATCAATLVVGCDAPFVNPSVVKALANRLLAADANAVVIRDAVRSHPLGSVYRPVVHAVAQALLDEGKLSLQELLHRLAVDYVDEDFVRQFDPDLRSLINVNTPEGYQAALRLIVGQSVSD